MRSYKNNSGEYYTLKSIISPICFHLNRWENGKCNRSSEEHLRKPKTKVKALIFVQKYEFCLVTQSL